MVGAWTYPDAERVETLCDGPRRLRLSGFESAVELGYEEPRINRLVKEAGERREFSPI